MRLQRLVPKKDIIRKVWHWSQRHREPYKTHWLLRYQLPSLPKNQRGRVDIQGWDIEYLDPHALASMFSLQVLHRYNDFWCDEDAPRILDCGANIGISALRFKALYPRASITAFEPDPLVCEVLRSNLARNKASDLEVVESAVWSATGTMPFASFFKNDSQSGHLISTADDNPDLVSGDTVRSVRTVWLGDYLSTKVDFLKLDIEGAELQVLESCGNLLSNVRKMLVEVHYHVDAPEVLARILMILQRAGFYVGIGQCSFKTWEPYKPNPNAVADQYPVIFAWRQNV